MISDEQLMLLEQFTYWSNEISKEAGVSSKGSSIAERVANFDEEALKKLENSDKEFPAKMTGKEWAAIIRAVQKDKDLMRLKAIDNDKNVHAICYVDPEHPNEAIVTFKGTTGQEEWEDNAEGLGITDTESQKEALEYIENLPYDNVTVVGHSKGGNKAQYVTILSDKVLKCVSMDGQGFSSEFLEKYYAEIEKKGGFIKNYYLKGDYVNILLFSVPGAEQICIQGSTDISFARNHTPSCFYIYFQDEDGDWKIEYENGETRLVIGEREEVMKYLQEFTRFILNVMPAKDRAKIGSFLGEILGVALGEEGAYIVRDGITYTKDNILDYLFNNEEEFGQILAYTIKYIETYNPKDEEIRSLLRLLGLEELFAKIKIIIQQDPNLRRLYEGGEITLSALILFLFSNIKDGKDDAIIELLFEQVFGEKASEVWKATEDAYHQIPKFDEKTVRNPGTIKETKIRDFSQEMYNYIMGIISNVESYAYESVSSWTEFAGEDWYDDLFISNAINGINTYFSRVSEINNISKTRIERVFDNVKQIDEKYASDVRRTTDGVKKVTRKILDIVSNLD